MPKPIPDDDLADLLEHGVPAANVAALYRVKEADVLAQASRITASRERPASPDPLDFAPEMVAVADLKPHPRNYRRHPQDEIDHIKASIQANGFYRNIVVASDLTILAGHGTTEAAQQMGYERIPVIRLDFGPDDPRAVKVLTGDNEIGHLAEIDDRLLSELLKEIKDLDAEGLTGTGYDEMMLASLVFVTRPASEIQSFDEAAHWAGMPEYDAGKSQIQAVVTFRDEEDRAKFVEILGVKNTIRKLKTLSFMWPDRERADRTSVRFTG